MSDYQTFHGHGPQQLPLAQPQKAKSDSQVIKCKMANGRHSTTVILERVVGWAGQRQLPNLLHILLYLYLSLIICSFLLFFYTFFFRSVFMQNEAKPLALVKLISLDWWSAQRLVAAVSRSNPGLQITRKVDLSIRYYMYLLLRYNNWLIYIYSGLLESKCA